jgi:hypothetical protein
MSAKPTINDFLALIDWHIAKADHSAKQAVSDVRRRASAAGRLNSGSTILLCFQAVRTLFDSGVETVLGELKRVGRKTELDRDELRQHAVQRLMDFAIAAKAIARTPEATGSAGIEEYVVQQGAALDEHLKFAVRQFDVGFFDPAEPEIPAVAHNSIVIGTMTAGNVAQASPGAKQSVEYNLEIEATEKALTAFEAALASASLPSDTLAELTADISTIRAQLAKSSPSRVIVQEAGKTLRNVVEGIGGGMLTPTVLTAATALWAALGFG